MGLSGSIFNFPLAHEEELRELLAIPESNEIHCVLPMGYPTDRHGPLKRKPVADVVYLNRFGKKWSLRNSNHQKDGSQNGLTHDCCAQSLEVNVMAFVR